MPDAKNVERDFTSDASLSASKIAMDQPFVHSKSGADAKAFKQKIGINCN